MAATHPHDGADPEESSDSRQALLQLEDDAAVMELDAAFWNGEGRTRVSLAQSVVFFEIFLVLVVL